MAVRNFFRLDDEHPFTGKHMLAVVFLFFGVIIGVNVVMAVSATSTFPGLIVQNSYVASQNYNALLEHARVQAARGLTLEIVPGDGVLRFAVRGADGELVRDLDVSVVVGRPSSTQQDRMLTVTAAPDGYRASEALPAGLWEVDVDASHAGTQVYRERRRIFVARTGQ